MIMRCAGAGYRYLVEPRYLLFRYFFQSLFRETTDRYTPAEAHTVMEPPAGRVKRASASKAEGFFRALASSGASAPGENAVDSKSSKGSSADAPDCSAGRGTSDSPSSDRRGRGASVDGSGSSVEGSGGGRQGQQQTKRKSGGGGRGAKEKGKVKTTGDRPLKSAGRNSGGGGGGGQSGSLPRGQPGMKPRPAATSASVGRVLGRLGEWGVKVRVSANPTVDDVWKAVDVVLRNLPDTSGLTVDALVGFPRLRRSTRKGSPLSNGDGGCGRALTGDAGDSASRRKVGNEPVEGSKQQLLLPFLKRDATSGVSTF